jgi:hypothetical protein
MKTFILSGIAFAMLAPLSFGIEAVHGTVTKVDSAAKTIVVKAADGTEHTLHFIGKTAVHGAEVGAHGVETGAKDTYHGLKEGSQVVAHYTVKGTEKTAMEVDKVGKEGLRETEGTISSIDRGGKKLVVKAADGTEQSFKIAEHAAGETGKGTEKAAKVTVFYTEEAGKKVAHFFEGR